MCSRMKLNLQEGCSITISIPLRRRRRVFTLADCLVHPWVAFVDLQTCGWNDQTSQVENLQV